MDKKFYAHTRPINENGVERTEYQLLSDHERGVGTLCGQFAEAFGAQAEGHEAGVHHDDGKATAAFQHRLLDNGPKVDHATAGARNIMLSNNLLLAACVMGHHSGLPDLGSTNDPEGTPTFTGRIKKWGTPAIPPLDPDYPIPPVRLPQRPVTRPSLSESFRTRMLYSCLVDADYLDTERFMKGDMPRGTGDSLETLLTRLQAKLNAWDNPTSALNKLRQQILQACVSAAANPKGIYTLTVPTGGGKTTSSLAFALHHAVEHGMKRVIYVVPYTSIIEQNADVFRGILGDENVLEHHSGVQFENDEENGNPDPKALAAENWDSPLVITTAVQFFESMYANRSSQCRKLHNLANSVIIFDEAQMLPLCHLMPCVAAIGALVEQFGATAVLCTATQPVLGDLIQRFAPSHTVSEICPQIPFYFDKFRRVTFRQVGVLEDDALAELLCAHEQVLCIVNSRKAAQSIFSKLPEEGSFHLSTLMVPAHRRTVLEEIRRRLNDGLPCRVVSTSLVEAGVDIDFPAVYRELAGLDSILQAAGRCNREGKRAAENSIVTIFRRTEKAPPLFGQAIGATNIALDNNADPASLQTMENYFRELRKLNGSAIDKIGVIDAFERGRGGSLYPFRTIAENFRMIDNDTRTVYIPWKDGSELIERLCDGACSKKLYRQLGQYAVQVYDAHFQALYDAGALQTADETNALDDRSAILCDLSLYDEKTGLSLKADSGQAFFG